MDTFSSTQRNYVPSHRKDALYDWLIGMLEHSFVLDAPHSYAITMAAFEELVEEHRSSPTNSRLSIMVPSAGIFHTPLPVAEAFREYDEKYAISLRRHQPPTFNEVRHIVNLAQVKASAKSLSLITFDGDQTLYDDGGNFCLKDFELAHSIVEILRFGIRAAMITAAGYGLDGSKYEVRLRGLLDAFASSTLADAQIMNFFLFGGECNFFLQAKVVHLSREDVNFREVHLEPVPTEDWQGGHLSCPKPTLWPKEQIDQILDLAEATMQETIVQLRLRAKLLRKDRAVGIYPGGEEMVSLVPKGHGSLKLKREALDEIVLRVKQALRKVQPAITLPYCIFNGGRDAWLDIGDKATAMSIMQSVFGIESHQCLHVGDQFFSVGNDFPVRSSCPCLWIISPKETAKILGHILKHIGVEYNPVCYRILHHKPEPSSSKTFDVYTGAHTNSAATEAQIDADDPRTYTVHHLKPNGHLCTPAVGFVLCSDFTWRLALDHPVPQLYLALVCLVCFLVH